MQCTFTNPNCFISFSMAYLQLIFGDYENILILKLDTKLEKQGHL